MDSFKGINNDSKTIKEGTQIVKRSRKVNKKEEDKPKVVLTSFGISENLKRIAREEEEILKAYAVTNQQRNIAEMNKKFDILIDELKEVKMLLTKLLMYK